MDKETLITNAEGDMVTNYILSDGWHFTKDLIMAKIMDLQSIRNITGDTPEAIVLDIKARSTAIDILMEIIREVEGRGEQHRNNKVTLTTDEEIFIVQN